MKRLTLLLFVTFIYFSVNAQKGYKSPNAKQEQKVDTVQVANATLLTVNKLHSKVNLNAKQTTEISALYKQYYIDRANVNWTFSENKKDRIQAKSLLSSTLNQRINALLNEHQKSKRTTKSEEELNTKTK